VVEGGMMPPPGRGTCPEEIVGSPYMCQQAAGHPDVVGDAVYTTTILRLVLLLEIRPSGAGRQTGMTLR